MTIKISELPSLESADLISTPTTIIPMVANLGSENTTYITTIANIKSYIEAGDFSAAGNVDIGGNLNVIGNINYTSTNNYTTTDNVIELHVANIANPDEPWTYDDGADIGIRLHWYGSAGENAAFVFSHSERAFEFYDTGALGNLVFTGNSYGPIKAGKATFVNTTPTTGNATGSLQTYGGMSATGNIWAGGWTTANNLIATYDVRSITSNTSGIAQVGSLRSNSTATIHSSLVTGGTATLNAVTVNGAATVGTTITASGNITASNVNANNKVTGSTATFAGGLQDTVIGNVTPRYGYFSAVITTTGNINGTLNTNDILPFGNANANIGSSSNRYQYVYAIASSALYADLAEKYIADAEYSPGTVVIFGGEQEITATDIPGDTRVAGAISTDPAYLMNDGSDGLAVALRGKVPVNVIGSVYKGDLLISSADKGYACAIRQYPASSPNAVFAKSLETDTSQDKRTIWAVIL